MIWLKFASFIFLIGHRPEFVHGKNLLIQTGSVLFEQDWTSELGSDQYSRKDENWTQDDDC